MNTVSFVFQNSRLIKASILENVRMGKPEATREEILAALHHAQCDDILEKTPTGCGYGCRYKGCLSFRRRAADACHGPRSYEPPQADRFGRAVYGTFSNLCK